MPDSFTDVAVIVAFLNFAGVVVGGFFAWQASKLAQKSIQTSQVNAAKLDVVKEKVQKVKDKVEHIETNTNGMHNRMLESAKKEGVQEGKEIAEAEQEQKSDDDLPPGSKPT